MSDWDKTLIAALPHTDYISVPGTEYSYSNIGYAILGAALSRVAGQPYTEWERSRVFKPLGMDRTRFEIDPSIAADVATGYQVNRDGTLDDQTAAKEGRDGRGYKVPNGAIFTTVDDLAHFVSFELGYGAASVLPRATLDAAFGGLVASAGDLTTGYGLGFMAMRRDTFTYVGHNGGGAGYVRQCTSTDLRILASYSFEMSAVHRTPSRCAAIADVQGRRPGRSRYLSGQVREGLDGVEDLAQPGWYR